MGGNVQFKFLCLKITLKNVCIKLNFVSKNTF